MKKMILIGVICSLAIFFSNQVIAAEIGFTSGIIKNFSGSTELFVGDETALNPAGTPLSIFVSYDSFRISYIQH